MSEHSYLSGKTSTRNSNRQRRFNPMGTFANKTSNGINGFTGLSNLLPRLHYAPGPRITGASGNVSQFPSSCIQYPCLDSGNGFHNLFGTSDNSSPVEIKCTTDVFNYENDWRRQEPISALCNPLADSNSLVPSHSDATVVQHFWQHLDPDVSQVSVYTKSTRQRKRTVHLRPKSPKYQGLSKFAAPTNLVSGILPTVSATKVLNPPKVARSSETQVKPHLSLSIPKKLSNPSKVKNNPRSNSTASRAEKSQFSASETPIDFLSTLGEEEWNKRIDALGKMVQKRKNQFLKNGFGDASGKPFSPDEPSLEKKPVPNRWVWYMRLSMEYDKEIGTVLPSGGPVFSILTSHCFHALAAGYLKYGWDRIGKAGKEPYQELADVYSAERVKHLSEHGIAISDGKDVEHRKKKDFPTPSSALSRSSTIESFPNRPEYDDQGQMKLSYPISSDGDIQKGEFYDRVLSLESNRIQPESLVQAGILHRELHSDFNPRMNNYMECIDPIIYQESILPAVNMPPISSTSEPFFSEYLSDRSNFMSTYLQSQDFLSAFEPPLTSDQASTGSDWAPSPLNNQSPWPYLNMVQSPPLGSNGIESPELSAASLPTPASLTSEYNEHFAASQMMNEFMNADDLISQRLQSDSSTEEFSWDWTTFGFDQTDFICNENSPFPFN
ncbi:uncharacterized protein MELLADRAFT_101302 [Melampsora larici-populina 98AG31]|uniref:Uncharacterized protein n=1 Tax=Melampsora larici-populina (strain 98AG31 / pathotype 3-4-7) TaxID=747676 RepID=F4R4A5_MELLP|nr:uncharacterized protein MELLADRAFT_101302 [Melampsora larici-populina 98AG31]EGG12775.1 hypothetical protein MELLADRAFT_101302 [Melampsora larici-populina 98AG31]